MILALLLIPAVDLLDGPPVVARSTYDAPNYASVYARVLDDGRSAAVAIGLPAADCAKLRQWSFMAGKHFGIDQPVVGLSPGIHHLIRQQNTVRILKSWPTMTAFEAWHWNWVENRLEKSLAMEQAGVLPIVTATAVARAPTYDMDTVIADVRRLRAEVGAQASVAVPAVQMREVVEYQCGPNGCQAIRRMVPVQAAQANAYGSSKTKTVTRTRAAARATARYGGG